ncbi:hypothetical protein [Leucobacter tenebrionis]|uniref:hypothetical protein n=1 Tax=Leucobacter tenebrionis TaxID=2873270 RepID=UPI001CA5FBD3|nr:hypothetical protein [Leucobacter tenebrionis]QZY52111.1 hypothetical protein KVY00_01145 [Leucobacter tenebrionis]
MSDVPTTWSMLGPRLSRRDAIALGEGAIHLPRIAGTQRLSRPPHATLEELEASAAAPYRRGGAALLEMLPLLSTHSASAPETHLRLALAEWGAPEPELDFDVYDSAGRFLGCSEIAFPEFRVLHEYEGDHHRVRRKQWHRDVQKLRDYVRADWDPIRVTSSLLYREPHKLRDQTFEALIKGGWSP